MEEISNLGCPVIAEPYPRACYGAALALTLPTQPVFLSKRIRHERLTRSDELRCAPWAREQGIMLTGIEFAEESEDDFDALMQAAALVRMIDSQWPLSSHLVDPIWEGGTLGTGGLTLRESRPPRLRSGRSKKSPKSPSEARASPKWCPIPGAPRNFSRADRDGIRTSSLGRFTQTGSQC